MTLFIFIGVTEYQKKNKNENKQAALINQFSRLTSFQPRMRLFLFLAPHTLRMVVRNSQVKAQDR